MRRSAPGASRRSRSQTQAPGGRAGGGRGSAHGTIIADDPRRYAPSPSRARASALQRHLPCCSSVAGGWRRRSSPARHWDSCGWPGSPAQVAARDERHVGAKPLVEPACSAGAGPPAPVARAAQAILCGCSAIGVELRPAGASGRSASRRLPSPGPGHVADLVVTAMGGIERSRPGLRPGAPDAGWHRRSAAGRPRWSSPRSLRHPAGRDRPVAGGRPCHSPGRTAPAPPGHVEVGLFEAQCREHLLLHEPFELAQLRAAR